MAAPRVLISTSSFGRADARPLELLAERGFEVMLNPFGRTLTENEAAELLADADGVIAGTEPLTAAVLAASPRLRAICRVGVGLDNVDLAAALARGVRVFNTPDAVTDAVAELTVGGLLTLLRRTHRMDAALRAGDWSKTMGELLGGKTVGVIGLGRVGKRVCELLVPFRVRLLAEDIAPDAGWAATHGVTVVDLPALLAAADVVTLHASGSDLILGAPELAALRPGAYVVNAARGGSVDEEALLEALAAGRLGGAYLDTFAREPYHGPLAELENVLLTPHVGSYAREARARMESEAVALLLAAFEAVP